MTATSFWKAGPAAGGAFGSFSFAFAGGHESWELREEFSAVGRLG